MFRQNLKMLLLTDPGERVMDPQFGVGLKRFLFELDTPSLRRDIRKKIRQQIGIYMPYVNVLKISIFTPGENADALNTMGIESNALRINLAYRVTPTGVDNILELDIAG